MTRDGKFSLIQRRLHNGIGGRCEKRTGSRYARDGCYSWLCARVSTCRTRSKSDWQRRSIDLVGCRRARQPSHHSRHPDHSSGGGRPLEEDRRCLRSSLDGQRSHDEARCRARGGGHLVRPSRLGRMGFSARRSSAAPRRSGRARVRRSRIRVGAASVHDRCVAARRGAATRSCVRCRADR